MAERIKSGGAWRGIIVGLVLLALWTLRPFGVDAPSSVETPFDTDRAVARLAIILGDERPHPTDSDANDAVEARLLAEIRKAGFTPQIDERRSEEHTSELQSLMRISYAVFCLTKKII